MGKKKRTQPSQPSQGQPMQTQDAPTLDAFQNLLARIGFGSPNLLEGTEYPLTRLTRDYNLMNSLYRSNWIVRKIIDTIPGDMCKNWLTINSQVSPELLDRFQKVERKTRTKAKILEGLKWGRLYGGAAAVMMIAGHEDYLDQPLDYDTVFPGSYKGLLVLDRWAGISPGAEVVEDINSTDFGLPSYYRVTLETGKTMDVHASRVLRFIGRDLPFWEKQAEVHWGISEIEVVYDELKKRDNTSWNIASLVFLANIRVLKMAKLAETLAIQNPKAQQALYSTLQAQNWLMSNMGMMVLNREDDFDTKQYSFTGLNDIYESFMLDLSGACEIPVTRLFGRSPAGMNATGESDLQQYYDSIEQKQEAHLRPALEKLFPVMALSTWGMIPDDLDFVFNPPSTMPSDKLAELAGKRTNAIVETYNAGLISQKTGMKELRQMEDETGMFSNITDEDIEAADATIQPQGELGGLADFGMGFTSPEAQTRDADRWITLGGGPNSEGESKGRKVLIDEHGTIVGGSLPKSAQGKSVSGWWKKGSESQSEKSSASEAVKKAESHYNDLEAKYKQATAKGNAYKSGMLEGGEGYNPHSENIGSLRRDLEKASEAYAEARFKLDELQENEEWTKEETQRRREQWNGEMRKIAASGKKISGSDLAQIEKKMGFEMGALKRHVARHKL